MNFGSYVTTGIIVTSVLFTSGCKGPEATDADKTLKIGAILSETGAAGAYGGEAAKGAELALDLFNKSEGNDFKVKYIFTDDKSDQVEAAKLAKTLIDLEKVDIIVGPAISPSALSVGKYAEERGVPIVATSPTLDSVTNTEEYNRRNVFRVCFNDSFQGEVLAKFAHDDLGKKTAGIIYDSTLSYSIGLSDVFDQQFTALGGVIAFKENYSVKDTDFSALVDKVKRSDVDVLFIPGWDENVGPMIRQANGKWDKFILLGGDGWPTDRLLELAGQKIPEAYALSHFAKDDPAPEVKQFVSSYEGKYDETPSPFSALGYDAMNVVLDAAKRTKSINSSDLRASLNETKGLTLATGSFSFDEFGNPKKAGTIVKISPQGFAYEKSVNP